MRSIPALLAGLALASTLGAEIAPSPTAVQPLLIGSEVPSAIVRQLDGTEVDLREVVGDELAVVVFYRGGW